MGGNFLRESRALFSSVIPCRIRVPSVMLIPNSMEIILYDRKKNTSSPAFLSPMAELIFDLLE